MRGSCRCEGDLTQGNRTVQADLCLVATTSSSRSMLCTAKLSVPLQNTAGRRSSTNCVTLRRVGTSLPLAAGSTHRHRSYKPHKPLTNAARPPTLASFSAVVIEQDEDAPQPVHHWLILRMAPIARVCQSLCQQRLKGEQQGVRRLPLPTGCLCPPR